MHGDNNVTKLIEMFEKHEDQFLEDMSQKQEINGFSEESHKLLDDMTAISETDTSRTSATSTTKTVPVTLIVDQLVDVPTSCFKTEPSSGFSNRALTPQFNK